MVAWIIESCIRNRLFVLMGADLEALSKVGEQIEAVLRPMKDTASVYSERVVGGNFIDIQVRREDAARFGLTVQDVQDIIRSAIGGMNITSTVEGLERYPVNLRYPRDLRNNLDQLRRVAVPTPMGHTVPLGSVADIEVTKGPPAIKSENARRTAWIYVDLMHFRNLAETTMIMGTLPFALVGGIWLMFWLKFNLSVAVGVGFIALAGLAAETGVVMLVYLDEAFERWRESGRLNHRGDLRLAIIEGAVDRVRPKLMTVATTLIGLLPVMFGTETGTRIMKRIAAPMVGGLVSSTVLTLVILPAVYYLWRRSGMPRAVPPEPKPEPDPESATPESATPAPAVGV